MNPLFQRLLMNRALRKPALVAGVVLVIVMTGGLLIRGIAGSDKPAPISRGDSQAVASVPVDGPDDSASEDQVSGTAPASRTDEGPRTASERRQLLETVGTLTAAHCYQTYVNIGLLADARAKGTYADKDASKVLDSVLTL